MFLRELTQPVSVIKGAGPAICAKLAKAGITTVVSLLLRYPRQDKYEDHITRRPLNAAIPDSSVPVTAAKPKESESREICTVARIVHVSAIYVQKKTIPCVKVSDGSAAASLFCFKNPELARTLIPGVPYLLWGNFVYSEKYHALQSSDFEIEREDAPPDILAKKHFGAVLPVYRLSEGLRQWHFRTLTQNALSQFGADIENTLPEPVIEKHHFLSLDNAIRAIHFPRDFEEQKQARQTLIYEELFYLQLCIAVKKNNQGASKKNPAAPLSLLQQRLLTRLPFTLTKGQLQAIAEVNTDMAGQTPMVPMAPMARLLQGDVGSGKTLVSFLAGLFAIEHGSQTALLAPTELLAFQHAQIAGHLLEPLGIRVAFLTGNVKNAGRKYLLAALASGEIDFVIGTHALFSADVAYKNLGLVIIDEQHRFGVAQRQSILDKGIKQPHLLMMSATPIPRTLAQTVFGAMDMSIIRELPPGRKPVITRTFSESNEDKVYTLVRKELEKNHQAYFVYPLIGEDVIEDSEIKNAESMAQRLSREIFPEYRTALLHSKLDDTEKKRIMEAFRKNEIQILAATSVVEVGVDVPNATCMIIEHAERFGLSALHQLRGRVGRGEDASFCFLVWTNPDVPIAREADGEQLEIWQKRLKVMRETNDGFVIAEEDMKLRGPGQITGTEQSGYLTLGLANLLYDTDALEKARDDAFALVEDDPCLEKPGNSMVAAVLKRARPFTETPW